MQVGWDTSNLKVLTKDGLVCETCCVPPFVYGEDCAYCPEGQTPGIFKVTFGCIRTPFGALITRVITL